MDNNINENRGKKCNKSIGILLNILFYSMLLLLVGIIIYPHTSFYFQKKVFTLFSIPLNKREIVLEKGKSDRIFVYAINKRVSYTTTDFKVVDVDYNGKVSGNRVGKAIIKVKVGRNVYKCRVQVLDINKEKVTLSVGKSTKLKIKGTWSNVRWESKNKKVAKVNSFGKVVGVSKGKTTIIAHVKGIEISCKVTIVK